MSGWLWLLALVIVVFIYLMVITDGEILTWLIEFLFSLLD